MAQDKLLGEILPDGSVRITTGAVSAPNHTSAETFLTELSHLTGGAWKVETNRHKRLTNKEHLAQHQHEHNH